MRLAILLIVAASHFAPQIAVCQDQPPATTNSIGMSFRQIPSGNFVMGVPENEDGRIHDDALPQHEVKITQPFYLSVYEVTQAQYRKVMGVNPSHFSSDVSSARLPVENVSWHDAQKFCAELSALDAESRKGRSYRLPTEAEWEYACRAGSKDAYSFGPENGQLTKYAWYSENSSKKTHPVGSKLPNQFGLFDMHGNVSEWCQDWKGAYPETTSTVVDPLGPQSGEYRIMRGASFNHWSIHCRSGNRNEHVPTVALWTIGFRIVMELRDRKKL